jgi:acyl dehydratase
MAAYVVGDVLFETTVAGSDRDRLALFSAATEDPNPIHVDEAFAKACGFPTVVQQGPMTTGQFARLLEDALGPDRLRVLDVTFTAPVFPGEALTLTGVIAEVGAEITCDLRAAKADGVETAKGFAVFAA